MGIFSQDKTTTNQTAYNQQTAVSNRDLSGTQVTAGAGARVYYTSLDEKALQTAAFTINHAVDSISAANQSNLTGFQNALSAVTEHQETQQQLQNQANNDAAQQNTLLGRTGITPQTIVAALAILGAIIIFSRKH